MLNINKIKWFLNEIDFLKENKIINDKDGDKLKNYYTEKVQTIKKAKSNLFIKILFFSLGILAALSIVGGITLVVVNFNWRLLSKELKTFLSFLLLVIPQVIAGYILCFKKKESELLKEIFSIVLSILFGVTIAFIGQIYQLPSDIESFLLTWSISTLFIIYLFNSLSSTAFYLVLIISLSSVMQLDGKIGLIFYPLIAALIPFYIIEFRKNSIFRIKMLDFFLLAAIIIGLGISMEKTVPGLWIIAYSNIFVIFYLFGILFEKEITNPLINNSNIFMSPIKLGGILGVAIMAFILIQTWPWDYIGWHYYRTAGKFNFYAGYFDYSICTVLPLTSIFLAVLLFIKKRAFNIIIGSFGILILGLFLFKSFLPVSIVEKNDIDSYIKTIILFYIFGLCIHAFYKGYKENKILIITTSFIFFIITSFYRFFMDYTMYDYKNNFFNISYSSLISIFILFYLCGLLFEDEENDKIKFQNILKAAGILGAGIVLYILTFNPIWEDFYNVKIINNNITFYISSLLINLVFPLAIILLSILILKKKKIINYAIISGGILTLVLFFIIIAIHNMKYHIPLENNAEYFSLIIVLYILILGVYSFYLGYKQKSSLTILVSSLYLFINIITRFFYGESSALFRGFSLVVIGLIFVLVDLYFIKKIKKES